MPFESQAKYMLTQFLISIGKPFFLILVHLSDFLISSSFTEDQKEKDKQKIFSLVKEFHSNYHSSKSFSPGTTYIKASGATYNENEMVNMVDVALDFWLTEGVKTSLFSQKLRQFT